VHKLHGGGITGAIRCKSDNSAALSELPAGIKRHKMSIQRRAPSHPPDNSAEVLRKMRNVQQLRIKRGILT
jgi:hypothetical protein